MQLMLERCLVSTGTNGLVSNTALALGPGVAASHTGCPLCKTEAFSLCLIAPSAAFSIASPEGSLHSTWRTVSRAALLSI